ncbi:MAG: single-stranded DNA-binding protein [Candidatus Marinimicrobia bacterium]|nr:single-stranded DNA-binding protein [Candidatus Neomarinimicrobiota bacterium]MCF7839850.1 single-stranded DNA-binding protein [Candidatus Neomarinimicrobiota bacterium]MCF7902562.1 single-stranded DNA-binding protein [Candidatus Neomarinimicrobiota bacterium]
MQRNSLNKVMLVGHLGADPDVRYTPKGTAIANLSLATNETHKDDKGEWVENTDWHKLVIWGKKAEFAEEYVKKGSMILVEGRLQTRNWEDKEKNKHYVTEVVCDRVTLLGSSSQKNKTKAAPSEEEESEEDLPF